MKFAIISGTALLGALFITEAAPAAEMPELPIKSAIVKDEVKISLYLEEELNLADCYINVDNATAGKVKLSDTNPMLNFTWMIVDAEKMKSADLNETGRRMLENLGTFRRISITLTPGESYTYHTKLTELFVLKPDTDYFLSVKGFFYKDYGPIHYQFTNIPVKFAVPGAQAKFENEDIIMTAQLNKLNFMPGEQPNVQISLQNKSNSPLGIVSAPDGATFKVEIQRKSTSPLTTSSAPSMQESAVKKQSPITLLPGEKTTLNDVGLNSVMSLKEPGEYGLKITARYLKNIEKASPVKIKICELNFTIKKSPATTQK